MVSVEGFKQRAVHAVIEGIGGGITVGGMESARKSLAPRIAQACDEGMKSLIKLQSLSPGTEGADFVGKRFLETAVEKNAGDCLTQMGSPSIPDMSIGAALVAFDTALRLFWKRKPDVLDKLIAPANVFIERHILTRFGLPVLRGTAIAALPYLIDRMLIEGTATPVQEVLTAGVVIVGGMPLMVDATRIAGAVAHHALRGLDARMMAIRKGMMDEHRRQLEVNESEIQKAANADSQEGGELPLYEAGRVRFGMRNLLRNLFTQYPSGGKPLDDITFAERLQNAEGQSRADTQLTRTEIAPLTPPLDLPPVVLHSHANKILNALLEKLKFWDHPDMAVQFDDVPKFLDR